MDKVELPYYDAKWHYYNAATMLYEMEDIIDDIKFRISKHKEEDERANRWVSDQMQELVSLGGSFVDLIGYSPNNSDNS